MVEFENLWLEMAERKKDIRPSMQQKIKYIAYMK